MPIQYVPIFISYPIEPPSSYKKIDYKLDRIGYNFEKEFFIPEKKLDAIDWSVIYNDTSLLKDYSKGISYDFSDYYEFSSDINGIVFSGVAIFSGYPIRLYCRKVDLDNGAVYAKYVGSPSGGNVPVYWDSGHIFPVYLLGNNGIGYPMTIGDGATNTYENALNLYVQPARNRADICGHILTMTKNIPEPVLIDESIINETSKNGYIFVQLETDEQDKNKGTKFNLIISGNKFIEKESKYSGIFNTYNEVNVVYTYYDNIYSFSNPEPPPTLLWHFEYGYVIPIPYSSITKNKQKSGYIEKTDNELQSIKNKFIIAISDKSNNKEETKYEA